MAALVIASADKQVTPELSEGGDTGKQAGDARTRVDHVAQFARDLDLFTLSRRGRPLRPYDS